MTIVKMTVPVEVDIQPGEVDVQSLLNKYPVLLKACAIRALNGKTIYGGNLVQLTELIDRVNPRFPTDSFSVSSLASLLDYCISAEEIDIIEKMMPEYSGDRRIEIRASDSGIAIDFCHAMKHSGMYYVVTISSDKAFGYPYTISLTTYADMDDLRNHWWHENPNEPEDRDCCERGDCNCEAPVAFSGEIVVAEDFDAEKVGAWIEEHLFDGQQEGGEQE